MSAESVLPNRLDRPVDDARDHTLGDPGAPIVVVEYGSYACPHCRAANDRIIEVRQQFANQLRYVFRHRPLAGSDIARRAAELAERARTPEQFWDIHVTLMTRSDVLTEEDLRAAASYLADDDDAAERARTRVDEDMRSAQASGVRYTPTFFINGERYDGAWDEGSFSNAMSGVLGHRVRTAALSFASWAPSAGFLLLLAAVIALVVTNSPWGAPFAAFWNVKLGLTAGDGVFSLSLLHWVNDGLLTIFFLVVGLEIKREFTVGQLNSPRTAALPVAAAVGGMVVPAGLYMLLIGPGAWSMGWGVPMATDTAFAVALLAVMGRRVPVELRVFLTAAAIADDIGAIAVVAVFYSESLDMAALGLAATILALLALMNRSAVYRITPYLLVGVVLWACVHAGGIHATLAGVLLAATIPTRPSPDYKTLALQADGILTEEARLGHERLRLGPSALALRALDEIHDRLESPADRLLRHAGPRSSYLVLPIFALANAGVEVSTDVFAGREQLVTAIVVALVAGKPLGFLAASLLAVKTGLAVKPAAYSWRQLLGAGALAGIGFTMSLFIAGQAFPGADDFAAAKAAVLMASVLATIAGVAILWRERRPDAHPEDGGGAAAPPDTSVTRVESRL